MNCCRHRGRLGMTTGAQLTLLEPGLAAGALENMPLRLQFRLCGSLIRRLAEVGGILSRVLIYPVAKLDHETDPPDSDGQQADSDAKFGCRRIRTGDNPDNASADYSERNAEVLFSPSASAYSKLPIIAEVAAAFG